MDKKKVKTIILAHFKPLFRERGFKINTGNLFVKVSDKNVLEIINFDFGSIGFTCSVALQPLYIVEPTKGIDLTFGQRLSRFKIVQKEWWSYDHPLEGLNEIDNLLEINGFPWLEEYSSPEKICEFILNKKFVEFGLVAFRSFHQKQYLAFSLLYIGRFDEGSKCIIDLINEIKDDATDFMFSYKKQLQQLYDTIKNQPDSIPEILNTTIIENKKCLKV